MNIDSRLARLERAMTPPDRDLGPRPLPAEWAFMTPDEQDRLRDFSERAACGRGRWDLTAFSDDELNEALAIYERANNRARAQRRPRA